MMVEMTNELEHPCGMRFIDLLTHNQKQAGYFVSQDEDFVWLWKAKNGKADIVATFLYDNVTIKQVREEAEKHRQVQNKKLRKGRKQNAKRIS